MIIINVLVVFVVLFISAIFYKEFSKVLDNRVLQQLNSIKTLKYIQFEELLNSEWENFKVDSVYNNAEFIIPKEKYVKPGIYDLTHLHPNQETSITFIKTENGKRKASVLPYQKIKDILLERTGMGLSGESYLVGNDYRLRSQSRFFPNKTPNSIVCKTEGALNAIKGIKQTAIFPDYRGVSVYSAYQPIKISNLNWGILSEMDVEEVEIPLTEMRHKLIIIIICILILAVILSLFLTKIITNPIIKMKENLMVMAKGNYVDDTSASNFSKKPKEINEMFEALTSLKVALSGAVDFSVEIGNMNLQANYNPKSADDLLGHTLLKMRQKLIAFRNKEQKINLLNKRILVERLEDERQKLARELHDGIGPFLTSLKFYVQNYVDDGIHKKEIKNRIDETITEVRSMTNALMPSTLEDFGLGATLKNYIDAISLSVQIQINFEDLSKKNDSNIANKQAVNLFRIVQELINNTIKHANATQVIVTLSEFDDFISLYYFDNGCGFDLKTIKRGSGITNIKERVEIFNGKIDINSNKGNTVFVIELPI
ncbi:sensor histidine kinase [Polaribacter sp. R77954]|uniref:sensor histidine kinase n=1 Tax=Polaribacter sp. R77954 TaxID=3093870 RepID=UPI0037CB75CD